MRLLSGARYNSAEPDRTDSPCNTNWIPGEQKLHAWWHWRFAFANSDGFFNYTGHTTTMSDPASPFTNDRRGFLKQAVAGMISVLLGLVPMGAGLAVFFDPLRRKSASGTLVKVATLEALPNDGVPRKFPVIAVRQDAWNKYAAVPIGAVYLRRTGEKSVEALNVICPHAGCPVEYHTDKKGFLCPCHDSNFALDGRINDPKSPAQRGLDSLAVEVRNENEIWVNYQNFLAGRSEKVPLS
jgi:Rieske Fe-S protein